MLHLHMSHVLKRLELKERSLVQGPRGEVLSFSWGYPPNKPPLLGPLVILVQLGDWVQQDVDRSIWVVR